MENFIVALVIVVVVGAAVVYIIKEKKKGVKCIGCPSAGSCASKNKSHCEGGCDGSGSCGCHTGEE